MADQGHEPIQTTTEPSGATAVAAPKKSRQSRPSPVKPPPKELPPWKVLLHNDDKNEMTFVVRAIVELTPLTRDAAMTRTREAHESGVALLLVTHKERAELYVDQFQSMGLTVSIEPSK